MELLSLTEEYNGISCFVSENRDAMLCSLEEHKEGVKVGHPSVEVLKLKIPDIEEIKSYDAKRFDAKFDTWTKCVYDAERKELNCGDKFKIELKDGKIDLPVFSSGYIWWKIGVNAYQAKKKDDDRYVVRYVKISPFEKNFIGDSYGYGRVGMEGEMSKSFASKTQIPEDILRDLEILWHEYSIRQHEKELALLLKEKEFAEKADKISKEVGLDMRVHHNTIYTCDADENAFKKLLRIFLEDNDAKSLVWWRPSGRDDEPCFSLEKKNGKVLYEASNVPTGLYSEEVGLISGTYRQEINKNALYNEKNIDKLAETICYRECVELNYEPPPEAKYYSDKDIVREVKRLEEEAFERVFGTS